MGEEQERNQSWQFVKWIFRVLYSPMKAFEEIVKKPDIKGPVLILAITLPIILGGQYISGTKFFLETPTPENDLWTEKPSYLTLFSWNSNGNIAFDNSDFTVGNYSVSASLINSSLIWMRLTNIGNFNCSKEEYSRLSFRLKWVNEANVTPTEVTLQLFSLNNRSRKFELDIKDLAANNTNIWANFSVNLATDKWKPMNSPSWDNVTGVGFLLMWADVANPTLKIDDLFFGKYVSISSSNTFDLQLAYSLVRSGVNFLLEWLILSGIVLLAMRSLSDWKGVWRSLFSIVGYVYSTFLVYSGALAVLFLFLPPFFLPRYLTSEILSIYQNNWVMPTSILTMLFYGWTTILCAIASKKIQEISWNKAFLIGFGAVVMSLLLTSFLLSAFL